MVGGDAVLPLPWLEAPLRAVLQNQQAHALLLHGPRGVGQFELATTLAQGWLCESSGSAPRPCGVCASCRLAQARSHPDLLVLLPDAQRAALGWGDAEGEEGAGDKAGKAKPSKEIKVEAVRAAVGFAQTTSARGRGKVVVVHPAERMNAISANTLLKTLEEPPGDARFLLACAEPDALLPTIRSRCQGVPIGLPPPPMALAWLAAQGVDRPEVLLAATGGQPLDAREWSREGIDAAAWEKLPAGVMRGDVAAYSGWPLPRLVDALQKLCHDALCACVGAPVRYFPGARFASTVLLADLLAWSAELQRLSRHAEHPWSAALAAEALLARGRRVLRAGAASRVAQRFD